MATKPSQGPAAAAEALTSGLVTFLTEGLRLAGVGKQRFEQLQVEGQAKVAKPLRRGDVQGVMQRIRKDFANAYFVTG